MSWLSKNLNRVPRYPNPPGAGRRDLAPSLNVRPSKRQS
jgi:hypothetical protein